MVKVRGCSGPSVKPLVAPPITSRRKARQVTTSFHRLTAALAAAEASSQQCRALKLRQLVHAERHKYQEASALNTSIYSTSNWVLKRVKGLGAGRRLLEIGAINTQLLDSRRVDARCVDLRSTSPRIDECDFFDVHDSFDIIVCSLVLNCVDTPERRSAMLERMRDMAAYGLVFLVLPRSCLERSRATTPAAFDGALRALGFEEVERRLTPKLLHLILTPLVHPFRPPTFASTRPFSVSDPKTPMLRRRKPINDFAVAVPLNIHRE